MYYIDESPQKARNTRVSVHVCLNETITVKGYKEIILMTMR